MRAFDTKNMSDAKKPSSERPSGRGDMAAGKAHLVKSHSEKREPVERNYGPRRGEKE